MRSSDSPPESNLSRDELRLWARGRRSGRVVDSDRVCKLIVAWLDSGARRPGWVVVYDPMPGEVDLSRVVELGAGPFATTRTPDRGRALTVHPWDSRRERHRYGYSQPVGDAVVVPDEAVSVVLVPALVFDWAGHRLGWGAGYYDRFLARLGNGVTRMGISDGAVVEGLPVEPHDIPMDLLATDSGIMGLPLTGWPPGGTRIS